MSAASTTLARRIVWVGVVGALLFALHRLGYLDALTTAATWRDVVREHAWLGALAYVVVHAGLAAVGIPSILFLVPAPLVFPVHEAFVLGLVGAELGAWLGFELARGTFRSVLAKRIPPSLRRVDESIARGGLRAVVVLRLTLFLLPPVAWALGLSRVDRRTYLVGTLVGMVPGVWFCTYVGGSFVAWLGRQPPWAFAAVVAAALVVLGIRALVQREPERGDASGAAADSTTARDD